MENSVIVTDITFPHINSHTKTDIFLPLLFVFMVIRSPPKCVSQEGQQKLPEWRRSVEL